jgi:hypothetical protein
VESKVADAVERGAKVTVGGSTPSFGAGSALGAGSFYEPTVLTGTPAAPQLAGCLLGRPLQMAGTAPACCACHASRRLLTAAAAWWPRLLLLLLLLCHAPAGPAGHILRRRRLPLAW